MAVTVTAVTAGSPCEKKGIQPGDVLLNINGHEIFDVLDYRFHITEPPLRLAFRSADGSRVRVICVGDDEPGLEFATYLMDEQRRCRNQCVFCFIDQMPKGLRDSLYFKDDDSRLSFLFGNYITLTNLTEREAQRMIDMHISPVNISVHTTDPDLRCRMMGNRFAGESLSLLSRFAQAGLRLNCQLVLCPGWNDGEALERSLEDLGRLMPSLSSVAAVPVGLTKYRDGLTPLRGFTKEEAAAVIDTMTAFGERMLREYGERVAYPSDEFYILAERPIPEPSFYGEYPQLENGVGVIALQREEFAQAIAESTAAQARAGKTLLATGTAAAPFLEELLSQARQTLSSLEAEVCPVVNRFFGESITVAGLVTGRDLIAQLQGKTAARLLIPECMLRFEGDRFLDDVTLEELEQALGIPVQTVAVDGASLWKALTEE